MLPLAINLSGSAAYYYTLGKAGNSKHGYFQAQYRLESLIVAALRPDLSLAVPITNSITFIFTLLTGKLLGERVGGIDAWAGILMIIAGITICVCSRLE